VQTDAFCKAAWMKSNFSLQLFPSFELEPTEQDCALNFFHGYNFMSATRTLKFLTQRYSKFTMANIQI
jgi:hypothetical protein